MASNPKALLGVLYAGAFVGAFNENSVNTALVDIMAQYDISAATAQWLVTGYMLVSTIIVTLSAFLYRRLKLRTLFFLGVAFLGVGLIGAVLAPSWPVLLATRLIQAIGTGVFIPVMMSTVLLVAPKGQLSLYLSIGGAMITFGPAFAPVITGAFVTAFGWRTAFVPALIILAVVALVGLRAIDNVTTTEKIRLDVASVLLMIAGLFAVIYGLSVITAQALTGVIAIVVGLGIIAVFARRQLLIDAPMLDLKPLANPGFWPAVIIVVVAMMTTFSMSVLLPLYFQGAWGMTAFLAGLVLLVPILVNAATSVLGGRVMDRRGSWPLLFIGMIAIVAGQVLGASTAQLSWLIVVAGAVLAYAGVGLTMSPGQSAGLARLRHGEHPHGVALMNSFIQIAASVGPSLFIGVMGSAEPAAGFSRAVWVAAVIGVIGAVTAVAYSRSSRRAGAAGTAAGAAAGAAATAESAQVSELTAADVMHDPVWSIDADATVAEATQLLITKRTSGVPVTRQGRAVGFLSDSDILKALGTDISYWLANITEERDLSERMQEVMEYKVSDVASMQVDAVTPDTPLEDVAKVFGRAHYKKIPVVSEGGMLVSSISRAAVTRRLLSSVMQRESAEDVLSKS